MGIIGNFFGQARITYQGFVASTASQIDCGRLLFVGACCGVHGAPHQFSLLCKLPGVTGGLGLVEQHDVFEPGLAHERCRLTLHPRRIVL